MVNLEPLSDDEEVELVLSLIRRDAALTGASSPFVCCGSGFMPGDDSWNIEPEGLPAGTLGHVHFNVVGRRLLAAASAHSGQQWASAPERQGISLGSVTSFIEVQRSKPAARPIAERVRDWSEVIPDSAAGSRAGLALHGLRHSVLSSGVPARQSHSGLESSVIGQWRGD